MSLGAVALVSLLATPLESVALKPFTNAALDLLILGKIPLTNYQITFDPLLLLAVLSLTYLLVSKLYVAAQNTMNTKMWTNKYLAQISI